MSSQRRCPESDGGRRHVSAPCSEVVIEGGSDVGVEANCLRADKGLKRIAVVTIAEIR